MLKNIKEIYCNKLAAIDGVIGQVKDFYFDDQTWAIRYLVADTGSWLDDRLVLLSPHSFANLDEYGRTLHIKLGKAQIQGSPSIDSHKPVSRQFEEEYHRYYGWPTYWASGGTMGLGGFPVIVRPPKEYQADSSHRAHEDHHLRSTQAVIGYAIQADDGVIGTVCSFMLDVRSWTIRDLVVDAGTWYSGKEILIPTAMIRRISYMDSKVFVNLAKNDIQQTAEHEVAKAGVGFVK